MLKSLTKVQQVNKYIRSSILRGKWAPGDKMPSERDLTVKLDASHQVIREAMSQLANEGIIERKHGSGTYVSKQQKVDTIAILVRTSVLASPNAYAYRRMVEELKTLVQASGYRPILFVGDGENDIEYMSSIRLMDQPVLKQVAGVISLIRLYELEDRLWDEGVPVVSISHKGRYTIYTDYNAMADMAVELLEQHGFSEFGIMHQDYEHNEHYEWVNRSISRISSHVSCACKVPFENISYDESCNLAYKVFKEFWASSPHPRAMFFFDDVLCDIALRAILELRIEVPQELAVLTQSNAGREFHFPVPLTCLEFDSAVVARSAWEMLRKLSTGETITECAVRISPQIRQGKSLG